MSASRYDVVVLAGDRGPGDPVAATAGAPGKVLAEVAGRPILARVLDAIAGTKAVGSVTVVCPAGRPYRDVLAAAAIEQRVEPAAGPAASVLSALSGRDGHAPVLVVTGDHALLESAWLERFAAGAEASGADAVVGVVDAERVRARFPASRRTRYRFSDVAVCGTNLFWFAGDRGHRAIAQWRAFEAHRKRPWRVIAKLGPINLLRYATGRLTLEQATGRLSRRLGVAVAAVFVDAPEAAVDVDTVADLRLVRALLEPADVS